MKSIMTTVATASMALLLSSAPVVAQQSTVAQWHANAQTLVAAFTGRGNAAQAYTMALIQVAVYDATVAFRRGDSTHKRKQEPFIADLVAPVGADLNAAIATAAFRVGYERVNSNPAARANYWNTYEAYIAGVPDGPPKAAGIAVGEAAAQAVLAARSNDNFYNAAAYANPAADPGAWLAVATATPYATAGANDYAMAFTMPLTASSPDARRIKAPPRLASGKYRRDFEETKAYGALASSDRSPAMTDVVQFWTESGFTLWSRNARDLVTAVGLDEFEAARALAAFSVATGGHAGLLRGEIRLPVLAPVAGHPARRSGLRSPHASGSRVDSGGSSQPPGVPGRSRLLRGFSDPGARTAVRRRCGDAHEHGGAGRRVAGGVERVLRLAR